MRTVVLSVPPVENGRRCPAVKETATLPWWCDRRLIPEGSGLVLNGAPVADLASSLGTPLYLYSASRVRDRLAGLRESLASVGLDSRIYYAMKANRHPGLLDLIRAERDVGIDACSPREVETAIEAGFRPGEISLTASMLSNRALAALAASRVHVNLDTVSAIRRFGRAAPRGARIGLRVDPGVDAGYAVAASKLSYGRAKLGLPAARLPDALDEAERAGLAVDTLHMHLGWGLQESDAGAFDQALAVLAAQIPKIPDLQVVNIGGGLGARHREDDRPLALDAWAAAVRRRLGGSGLTLACEPGTLLVAAAGVLVVEVNTVNEKDGRTWVGVDAGHNINVYPLHYKIPLEVVHVTRPLDSPARVVTIVGNINEAGDVFAQDVRLPEIREGDLLAFLPAGAYGASMSSDHCLRGNPREFLIDKEGGS